MNEPPDVIDLRHKKRIKDDNLLVDEFLVISRGVARPKPLFGTNSIASRLPRRNSGPRKLPLIKQKIDSSGNSLTKYANR
jgi:hypothetical protein